MMVRTHRPLRTAALVAAVLLALLVLAGAIAVTLDPYRLVRAEFARQRWDAGLSRSSVDVAGHRWIYAYTDDAPRDAPVVVMVHGYTGSKENWYLLSKRLRGKYRLVIPDLPGWGESEREADADYGYVAQRERLDAFVRAISPGRPVVLLGGDLGDRDADTESASAARLVRHNTYVRALSPGRPAVLLGHSRGGSNAALTAARHPRDIARVGLFAAAGVRFRDNQFGTDVLA